MIDRVFNDGAVVDFMIVGTGPLHTGVFNVADMAITAGVFLVVFSLGKKNDDVVPVETPIPGESSESAPISEPAENAPVAPPQKPE
jgi:hypothetical protein